VINYVFLGFEFPVDGFYMHSFEIWLATTVVFFGSGNVGFTLLEYRLGHKSLLWSFAENVMWIPFLFVFFSCLVSLHDVDLRPHHSFFFFGGLSIPVSQAILAHLFSYNMTWAATKKEVERSNFWKEIPAILKRFRVSLIIATVIIAGMIVCSTSVVPYDWRVDSSGWAVIFPLAVVAASHILFPVCVSPLSVPP
jgi:hypothetical protein